MVSSEETTRTPFQAHIALLQFFLSRRDAIVERIQGVLGAQQQGPQPDRAWLSRQFEDCFFGLPGIAREQAALRGQLQQAHWAQGFRPRDMPGIPNEMFDPADMMLRAFTLWQHTRWPGRNGRLRFAHTLFNLYVVRCLALLDMRIWDSGPEQAGARLSQVQQVLDRLWQGSPADQPVLVRDARWLIPVAQSPTTDDLGSYFQVAARIAEAFSEEHRLEIHRASVVMAGGHLRSQLRHFIMQGRSLADHDLLLSTRRSNALDCAMTIQALVPLLKAYAQAIDSGDEGRRFAMAGVICQGISPDPSLFVLHLDLLRAYSMIEHLFVTAGAGRAALTPMGQRHVALVEEYTALMPQLARELLADCPRFRPQPGVYSPYGVMFGFSSNLLEHMTIKALQPDAERRFSLEDVFADAGTDAARLEWVSGWRRLPHMSREVQQLYAYPQQFAEDIFGRIEAALRERLQGAGEAARRGRLFVVAEGGAAGAGAAAAEELPARFILSSDPQRIASGAATPCEQSRLLLDRNEGEFVASFRTAGGWVALSKDLLTDVLGAGRDARVVDVPPDAAAVIGCMAYGLVAH